MYQFVGETAPEDDDFSLVGDDSTAPFQFNITVPRKVGETLSLRALAKDVDGFESLPSAILDLEILEDQPPLASIIRPANDESVIIDGQDIEVVVEAIDDFGDDGIDRVVFYVNDVPVTTVRSSLSQQLGTADQDNLYAALLTPPEGVDGVVIHAIVFDNFGHSTRTTPVRVGLVEDTVKPDIDVLQPANLDIITGGEPLRVVVAVSDIGSDSERHVFADWVKEYQDVDGHWVALANTTQELLRNDTRDDGDLTPVSDPSNFFYVYLADFADGNILSRTQQRNERVRLTTRVVTDNHSVESVTHYEVGLPLSERRFLLPDAETLPSLTQQSLEAMSQSIYYTAVDQFVGENRTGAIVGAWSTIDPMRLERDLGNLLLVDYQEGVRGARTGLYLAVTHKGERQ